MRRRQASLVIAAVVASLTLAACGGGDADSTATPTAAPTPTSTALVGGDPSTWAPVEVTMDMNGQVIDLVVGQAVNFTDLPELANPNVGTSAPLVIEPHNPTDDGSMQTGAGVQAVGVGGANVIVWDGFPADGAAEPVFQVNFRVKEQTGAYPPAVVVPKGTKAVELVSGQIAVFEGLKDGFTLGSKNEMAVVVPTQDMPTADQPAGPWVLAVGEGTSKVKLFNPKGKKKGNAKVTVTAALG